MQELTTEEKEDTQRKAENDNKEKGVREQKSGF